MPKSSIDEILNHFAGRLRAHEVALSYLLQDLDKERLELHIASLEADLLTWTRIVGRSSRQRLTRCGG